MNIALKIKENVGKVILGKDEIIDLLMTALISGGHVLLEDVPGVGKTTMAKALAKSISCDFKRIQFTPDLLPTDLTGINYFNQKAGEFEFRKGPLFTNILLADEINRATPRTQSSLLECMEERQISVEGDTHKLEKPFFVLATQNPIENYGTFPLPEAQLDRFLMKVKMGYPERAEEQKILDLFDKQSPLEDLTAVCSSDDIINMQQQYVEVTVNKDVSAYILDIIEATRKHEGIELGASPRASIALYKAAQAYAYINGRKYVRPDDIIYLAPTILSHRIILKGLSKHRKTEAAILINEIISSISVPVEKMV
ncbi:MAG: ATPase associated with various cellular 3 [Clostridia bacterium]|jgi:MoxR-like ATPase|nr:ATPase associated with various cellular 3 [Clostridia bacterium]